MYLYINVAVGRVLTNYVALLGFQFGQPCPKVYKNDMKTCSVLKSQLDRPTVKVYS
jgi:hypothetical protein